MQNDRERDVAWSFDDVVVKAIFDGIDRARAMGFMVDYPRTITLDDRELVFDREKIITNAKLAAPKFW